MEDKQVTGEELQGVLAGDFKRLAEEVAQAMNGAQEGRIIADTEEPVREAHAVFREQMYTRAIRLLQEKQEAFSPSARGAQEQGPPAGHASDGQRASERV